MKQGKKILSLVLSAFMLVSALVIAPKEAFANSVSGDDDLPENIVANKDSFDTIDQVIATYEAKFADMKVTPTQYVTSVNGESRIRRLNFIQSDEPMDVSSGIVFDIPEDIARVFRLFGDMRFTGSEGFITDKNLVMSIIDPDGTEYPLQNDHIYWSGEYTVDGKALYTTYAKISRIKDTNDTKIATPWNNKNPDGSIDYTGYKLKLQGNGTLNFVYIWEEQGMPTEYDTSAYTIMGKDKPILDVSIDIDTTKNLSINGVNKFESDVFKRYHVNSGPVQLFSHISDWILDDEVFFKTTHDWGFLPGRGAFHFSAAYNAAGLVEDANKPGWSDFTETYKNYAQNDTVINKLNTLFPSIGNDYCITFDGWPSWTWENPENTSMDPHSATPGYSKFDSAADTAAQLYKAINTRMGGYGPKYLEVKNESTIVNEWNFFNTDTKDVAWQKLGEFHNKVADEVKKVNPDVLVGGPSTAFMYLEQNDFAEAQYQLDFMDDTKGHLDWYSHHFYENSNLYVNDRTDNSDGFLSGRFEAVMDLLRAHMENTDNVKPILITEEGSYNGLSTDIDYFQNLTAFNGYLLRFTDYADTIDMLVPYLYPVMSWKPNAVNQFYRYKDGKLEAIQEEMTPLEAYLDLWKEFKGAYVPSEVNCDDALAEERVFTKAVRYGDKVYLAVQNLNKQRLNLDLNLLLGDDVNISSVTKKHYYLEKATLTYEEMPVADINDIYMRVQEMAVFEITLSDDTAFESELLRHIDYAEEELVDTGKNKKFTIDTTTKDIEKSVLRIGFGKTGSGFDGNMTVSVNGKEIGTRSLEYTNKSGDLLTFIEFDTSTSLLKNGKNKVTVSMPEGGKITSMQFMNYYNKTAKTGLNTTPVKNKMQEAINCITDNLYISDDGLKLPEGSKWITQLEYDAFVIAIKNAQVVLKDTLASEEEISDAINMLNRAIMALNQNLKDPIAKLFQLETVSFEDGEDVVYSAQNGITIDTVAEHPSDGAKSLKATFGNLATDNNFFGYKRLLFNCPEADGWDVSKGYTVDIHNPNDYEIQVFLSSTDATNNTGWLWNKIPANQTKTITMSDFSARATDWAAGNWAGMENGLDGSHIKTIGLSILEKPVSDAGNTDATIYIDNIKAITEEIVPFELVTFEDGEPVNYTVSQNDTTKEIVENNNSKALKITALTTDDTWGKLSILKFQPKAGNIWDFSKNNLKFDVTNPHDFDVPIAVFYDSANTGNNSAWINIPAGQTIAVNAAPYDPKADSTKIVSVRIFVNESAIVGKENVSIIVDNVSADWTPPTEEEVVLNPAVKPDIDLTINSRSEVNIRRGEFVARLIKALGLTTTVDSNFTDVKSGSFWYIPIGIAKKLGISVGTGKNHFDPSSYITREEMAVFTCRAIAKAGKNLEQADVSYLEKFTDKNSISPYAVNSMSVMVKIGMFSDSGTVLDPKGYVTLGEMETLLNILYFK